MKDDEKNSNAEQITYLNTQTIYLEKLASEGVSKQQIKNIRFVVPSWCNTLELELTAEIGNELNQSFNKNVTKYITKQIESNIKKSTYSSRVSIIKKFRQFYLNYKETNFLPKSLGGRLKFFLEKSGVSTSKFVKIHLDGQADYNSFLCWVQGKTIPKKSSYQIVEVIEKKLKLSPGTLTSTLPHRKIDSPSSRKTLEFRQRMMILVNNPHRVLTELLKKEFDEFTEYKLTPTLPENMKRLSAWTRNENGEVQSALLCIRYVTDFAGFLCLSPDDPDPKFRGRGFDKKQMTMAWLTDKQLVEEYITVFRKNRSDGKYNNYHITVLSFITSILRKDTGYLYQKPEFAEKIGLKITAEEWRARCINTRNRLLTIKKSIEDAKKNGSDEYCFGRDPKQPIQPILDLKYPLSETLKMTEKMLADVEKLYSEPFNQARLFRNTLLIAIVQANPLRASMLEHIKIDENLVKKPDGSWWIEFTRNSFKNRRWLKDDYSVQLSPNIWGMIERYLKEFRPRFERHVSTNILFVNSKPLSKNGEPSSPYISAWATVSNATKKYIPNCSGFGPQAMRHIIGSSLVKSDATNGINLAAHTLNDDPITVSKNYVHVRTNDKFALYNDYFDDNWGKAGLKDAGN